MPLSNTSSFRVQPAPTLAMCPGRIAVSGLDPYLSVLFWRFCFCFSPMGVYMTSISSDLGNPPRKTFSWFARLFRDRSGGARNHTSHHYNVGPFHDISMHGRHIHHMVWGIFLLLTVGYCWLSKLEPGLSIMAGGWPDHLIVIRSGGSPDSGRICVVAEP